MSELEQLIAEVRAAQNERDIAKEVSRAAHAAVMEADAKLTEAHDRLNDQLTVLLHGRAEV